MGEGCVRVCCVVALPVWNVCMWCGAWRVVCVCGVHVWCMCVVCMCAVGLIGRQLGDWNGERLLGACSWVSSVTLTCHVFMCMLCHGHAPYSLPGVVFVRRPCSSLLQWCVRVCLWRGSYRALWVGVPRRLGCVQVYSYPLITLMCFRCGGAG